MKLRALPTIRATSIGSIGKSQQNLDREYSPPRLKVNKVKTALIARKVHTEDLYGSIIKQSNVSGLTQIKEEKMKSPETLSSVNITESAESEVFYEPKVLKSIFQTEALVSPKYREYSVGPLYKNNKLIQHSIVGSTTTFEKYQKSLQRTNLRTLHSTDFDSQKTELVVPRTLKVSTSIVLKDDNTVTGRTTASTSAANPFPRRLSVRNKPRTEAKKETKISKENLIDKIEEMKREQEDFYKTQAMGYNKLTLRDRLCQTKEERRINSFNSTMENWQKTTADMCRKAGRSPKGSVMSRNESFRGKKEIADLLEEGKTDSEKLGTHFWHISLRKYGDDFEQGNHNTVMRDLPEGFETRQLNKTVSHFQLIRKPIKVLGGMMTTTNFEKTKQIDRTYQEYLSTKVSKLGKLIKKIKPAADMDQIGTLTVEGKNKLEMEASLVCREDTEDDGFFIAKNFFQPKNEEKTDQTIHEFYEKTMVSRNGHSAYL